MAEPAACPRRFVQVGARRLHFFHHPLPPGAAHARPPLVLIHGAGGDYLQWPPRLRRLVHAAVYALDLPGHGQSDGPGCSTVAEYRDVVHGFIQALGLARVVVAGHSLGGAVALAFAHAYPAATAGLGLVGSGARLPVEKRLLDLLRTDFAAATAELAARIYGPAAAAGAPAAVRARTVAGLRRVAPETLLGDYLACAGFDMTADLAAIAAPALIVGGAADRMVDPVLVAALHAGLARSHLSIHPTAGHLILVEEPAFIVEKFAQFLARWAE
jgi:pimeloyl-ACP methyl ester carboxylesterase